MQKLNLTAEISFESLLDSFRDMVKTELQIQLSNKKEEEKLISRENARQTFTPPVSKVTILKWERQGKIQSYRIGGRVYYKRSEIIDAVHQIKRLGRKSL